MSSFILKYTFGIRSHKDYLGKNYLEHKINLNCFRTFSMSSNIYITADACFRNYQTAFVDTLYNNDYFDGNVNLEWRHTISQTISFILRSDASLRTYQNYCEITPDYHQEMISLSLRFQLRGLGALELGYRTEQRKHTQPDIEDVYSFITSEDFTSHGPVISLEILSFKGLILTLTDTYEFLSYPHSQTDTIQQLSLYSDREKNSLMLFLSWPLSHHWEVDLFANLDNDSDTKERKSNSHTTLFNLELRYLF